MKMAKKHEYDWNTLLQAQQQSGMNMKRFCRENNIPYGCFKNHKYALQEKNSPIKIVSMKVEHPSTLDFKINGTEISVDVTIDDLSLKRILKVLSS